MASNTDTRQLQLQISASAELLIRNLKTADNAVAEFQRGTDSRLSSIDARFAALGKLKSGLGDLDARIGIGDVAAAATGATLVTLAKGGLDYASSLGEVAQQVGVTTQTLQLYRYMATQVGIEQEEMDKGLAKLTQTMGKAELGAAKPTKAFAALGITIDELRGRDAGDIIPLIAAGLAKIESPAQRAALEIELFGKAGQKLDTLLAGGPGQIDELTKAAEDLGLVLSDDLIARADEAADKLSEVQQVISAQIAGVVAENAASITRLAGAMGDLVGWLIKFNAEKPEAAFAMLGLYLGGRLGGLPGAAVGAAAGLAVGTYRDEVAGRGKGERYDSRTGRFTDDEGKALPKPASARRPSGTYKPTYYIDEDGNRVERAVSLQRVSTKPKSPPRPGMDGDAPPIFAPTPQREKRGKSAGQVEREREAAERKDRSDQRRADGALLRAQLDDLAGRADVALDPDERLRLELERIDLARKGRDLEIEDLARENKYVAANAAKLKALNGAAAEADKEVLQRRRAQEVDQAIFETQRAQLQDEGTSAEIAARMAVTRREQIAVEQRILEARQALERLALQQVIDDKTGRFSPAEKDAAGKELARLLPRQQSEREAFGKENQGQLADYRDELRRSAEDMNDALQGVAVDGLKNLEDGLVGIVTGTESVGSAFKKMAASIIADLARIAIQKAILKAIGGSFLGFADGGSLDGVPGRADGGSLGGLIRGPGTGRSDSVLALLRGPGGGAVRLSNREFIMNERAVDYYGADAMAAINARQLPRFADGGSLAGTGFRASRLPGLGTGAMKPQRIALDARVQVDAGPEFEAKMVGVSARVVGAASEPIMAGAESRTLARASRPSLPGGLG